MNEWALGRGGGPRCVLVRCYALRDVMNHV